LRQRASRWNANDPDRGSVIKQADLLTESPMSAQKRPNRPRPAPKPDRQSGPRHVADEPLIDPDSPDATVQSPITDTGLPVEEQVRKEWDPKKKGGLPILLKTGAR
jgi:hypothetical protein